MDTVSLAKELDFIRSYLFLLEIRYENRLAVDWDIPGTISERRIVPATLQLLVENVIKHNVIAKKKPLRIRIFLDDQEYLVISNDLQKKDITGNSSGFGLNSIASRYKYLTERPVVIEDNGQSFIVKIPLI
jgi:sensor histidine kinase YesM